MDLLCIKVSYDREATKKEIKKVQIVVILETAYFFRMTVKSVLKNFILWSFLFELFYLNERLN